MPDKKVLNQSKRDADFTKVAVVTDKEGNLLNVYSGTLIKKKIRSYKTLNHQHDPL